MSNSKLNSEFFSALKESKWKIGSMSFIACNLADSIGDMINNGLNLDWLQIIDISSDRFSNKGIKKIMKLNLPKFKSFCNSNTNITSDGLKTFNKKINNYKRLVLNHIQDFIDMNYIKIGVRMLCDGYSILFATAIEFSQDQCPYLSWLSKLERP